MTNNEIKVNFKYALKPDCPPIICKPNETIKQICLEFSSRNGINFDSIFFLINGKPLLENDYNKPIIQFIHSGNEIGISVQDKVINESENESLNENKNATIIFWFNSDCIKVQCTFNTKMVDVLKIFANSKGVDYNSLNFLYKNNEVDYNKTFKEIADQRDINKREIDIYVDKKIVEEESVRKSYNKKILIISIILATIILIAFIILLIFLLLKKKIATTIMLK